MDIGLALTYVTRDPQWIKKVLIGGLLLLIPIVGSLIIYGYGVRIARNVITGVEQPLPEWDDIGGDLSRGFFMFVGTLIWALPIIVLYVCSIMLSAISDSAGFLGGLFIFCLVFPLSILLYVFVIPTLIGRFASTNDFGSMLQFNEIIATIRGAGVGPYLLFFVLLIVTGFIGGLGLIACFIGVLFTLAYASFANFHGAGQIYRQIEGTAAPTTEHPAF